MAAHSKPRPMGFLAEGVIAVNRFVKYGADEKHVLQCGANQRAIGVSVNAAAAAEDKIDIHLLGGGSKVEAAEAIALGQFVTSDANGKAEVVDAADEFSPGMASEIAAADGDIIGIELQATVPAAAE